MNTYSHLFFDLDNTLWDFNRNSTEVLEELYHRHNLPELGIASMKEFISKYQHRNEMMWEQYRLGKIDKETLRDKRFALTFWDLGIDPELAPVKLSDDYLEISATKNHLFPHAHEALAYLSSRYMLHIITNGFEESQQKKMMRCDLNKYFRNVIISEHTGFRKPDKRIFQYAVDCVRTTTEQCLMIGDGLVVDILGAKEAGWDTLYFNPGRIAHNESPTFEVDCLSQLLKIL